MVLLNLHDRVLWKIVTCMTVGLLNIILLNLHDRVLRKIVKSSLPSCSVAFMNLDDFSLYEF